MGLSLNGNQDTLQIFASTDGINFVQTPVSFNANTGHNVRDTAIAKFGSTWWVAFTALNATQAFGLTSSTDLQNWTNEIFANQQTPATVTLYAPNWVRNPDGTPYFDTGGCPHVVAVYQPASTTFQLAETHPTVCNDFTQAWTNSVVLALPTGETVPNQLDPYVICMSPSGGACNGTGDTFYLWYLELTLNTSEFINYASSSTLTGQYTLVSPGGNWAGWPSPTQEGPALIKLSDRWRMYMDIVGFPPGDLTHGQIYYSDSFDNWATWTRAQPVNTVTQAKHGTVIPFP